MDQPLRRQPLFDNIPDWQAKIWAKCAVGLMMLIIALVVVVAGVLLQLLSLLRPQPPDNALVFSGMTVLCSSLLRLLAILIGGAIAFAGLAVSFFAHENATSMNADLTREQLKASTALAINSPGIVAVVIGAVVIVVALSLRGTHTYSTFDGRGEVLPQSLPPLSEVLATDENKSTPPNQSTKPSEKNAAPVK